MFNFKILKNKTHDNLLKDANNYHIICTQLYWFSEWKQLDPIWDFIRCQKDVSRARDEFRELSAKSLGYSLTELNKMEIDLAQLRKKVKYFEDIIAREKPE